MLFYVNSCRNGWVLTFNPFHPVLAQTEHPLIAVRSNVSDLQFQSPSLRLKTLVLLMTHALAYKFSFVLQGKSIKLCIRLRLQLRGFAYSYRRGQRMCNRTKTMRKGERKNCNKPVS